MGWSVTQYDLLRTIAEKDLTLSASEAARLFRHTYDGTFRKWMTGLQDAGLLVENERGYWSVTPQGHKVISARYVSVSELRLLRRLSNFNAPVSVEELQITDERLPSLRAKIQHLRQMKWLESREGYRNKKFRTLYKLTYSATRVLDAYRTLGIEE